MALRHLPPWQVAAMLDKRIPLRQKDIKISLYDWRTPMTTLSRTVHEIARQEGFHVSLEVFPARTEKGREGLCRLVQRLEAFGPEFVSVTYGAGGSSRDATLETIEALIGASGIPVAGHLTCAGASREDTLAVAQRYVEMGVRRIVALRGDPQEGEEVFHPHPDGFANAAELTAALRDRWPEIAISVAAYPEKHPESPDREADIANLKAKFDAGADDALTQFFFDNDDFLRFVEDVRTAGVSGPVIPGIMLTPNFYRVKNFAVKCQASIPEWLETRFAGEEPEDDVHALLAGAYAIEQVLDLAARGVRRFHLFTMNRPQQAEAICRVLGMAGRA